jgi:hypothetical protein
VGKMLVQLCSLRLFLLFQSPSLFFSRRRQRAERLKLLRRQSRVGFRAGLLHLLLARRPKRNRMDGVSPPPFYFLVSLATSFCFLRFCVLFTRTWKDWLEDDPSWLTFSFAPSLCGPRGGPRFLIRIRDRWDARRPSRISTFVYSVASSELPFWAESKKFDESRRQAAEKNWVYRCRTMPLGYLSTFLGFGWFMTWWGSI